MSIWRRIGVAVVSVAMLGMFWVGLASAQTNLLDEACRNAPADSTLCRDDDETRGQSPEDNRLVGPNGILNRIAQLIAYVSGIAGIILILIGGFRYITASGDSNNINTAKNTILYAIVGLAVAATTQSIIAFVLNKL